MAELQGQQDFILAQANNLRTMQDESQKELEYARALREDMQRAQFEWEAERATFISKLQVSKPVESQQRWSKDTAPGREG
jgi:hypothetical protein